MADRLESHLIDQQLQDIPDDVLMMSLKYLSLVNQISLRRVCKRFQSISDRLLSCIAKLSKLEMQSFPFDGREKLLKQMNLTNLRIVSLVSIELNEQLAKHLAQHSPYLKFVNVDGTCYNRCLEFVEEYLTQFTLLYPGKNPKLQVNSLIETDEKLRYLMTKFPKWDLFLSVHLFSLNDWVGFFDHIRIITVTKNCSSIYSDLSSAQTRNIFPNLHTVIFSGVSQELCSRTNNFIRVVKEVIFEDICPQDYSVMYSLEDVKLEKLHVNLNHHKTKETKLCFFDAFIDYMESNGKYLKFVKVTTSLIGDSVHLIQTLIDLNLKNIQFEIGNPSEKSTFSGKKLIIKHWSGSLSPLLNAFDKVSDISIVTDIGFDVFEWIGEIKKFSGEHRNRLINASILLDGYEATSSITVSGSNYNLTFPKVAGLNFILAPNNVLFAYNLAEMSQLTALRNQSLTFMKNFIGNDVASSPQEICSLFKLKSCNK